MRDARIGFPSENPLKLARVSLRGGIPLHADSHIFVDAPARSSSVIDEGDNGLLGFFRRQVTAHQSLQRRRFCLYGIFPPASSAAKRAAIFTLRLGNYFGKCSATTCTYSASMVKVNGLSNIRPIASLVLFDLEAQESVDCCKGRFVRRGNNNTSPIGRFLERVMNIFPQPLHFWHSGRNSIVNEHRNIEISTLKCFCDVS